MRFPEARDQLTALEVAGVITDLNDLYELTALAVLPGYEKAALPSQWRPRRRSRLIPEDELTVGQISYGSELTILLGLAGGLSAATFGVVKALPSIVRDSLEVGDNWASRNERRAALRTRAVRERLEDEDKIRDIVERRHKATPEFGGRLSPGEGPDQPWDERDQRLGIEGPTVADQVADRLLEIAGPPVAEVVGEDPTEDDAPPPSR
ncbi:MAG: hypothetical protein Q8R60_06715 [Mycobacteriales bacterium]|nr:hypothetical protein [Mycobacteriales bacterium]